MNKKLARQSFGSPYECLMPWPTDCGVQCGSKGLVFTQGSLEDVIDPKNAVETLKTVVLDTPHSKPHYRTAFFEAFPTTPSCFIRGEGTSIEEAEAKAYAKFKKIINCGNHDFDRRGREDGYAYCTKCPYSSTVLDPLTNCWACKKPTHYAKDKNENWYCEEHYYALDINQACLPLPEPSELATLSDYEKYRRSEKRRNFITSKNEAQALLKAGFKYNTLEIGQAKEYLMHAVIELSHNLIYDKVNSYTHQEAELMMQDPILLDNLVAKIITQFPNLLKK